MFIVDDWILCLRYVVGCTRFRVYVVKGFGVVCVEVFVFSTFDLLVLLGCFRILDLIFSLVDELLLLLVYLVLCVWFLVELWCLCLFVDCCYGFVVSELFVFFNVVILYSCWYIITLG